MDSKVESLELRTRSLHQFDKEDGGWEITASELVMTPFKCGVGDEK